MAIQSRTRLGPYEILSAIGAGEMGRDPIFVGESDGNCNGCFRLA
jgi:hypothetical protein